MVEIATERLILMLKPTEKAWIEAQAREAGLPVGEFVRQALFACDPDEFDTVPDELVGDLHAAAAAMRHDISKARISIARNLRRTSE